MSKLAIVFLAAPLWAQDPRQIVTESQNRARSKSERYEGTLDVINANQKTSTKRWTFARLGGAGESKAILRFTAPADLRGVALLVITHPDHISEQWMWIPSEERDRKVALQDRSQRFFGTDFSFEDMEEREVAQYDYKLLGREVEGAPCWKIESRPKPGKASQYTSSILWIRQDNYVVARADNFKDGKLVRRIAYRDIQRVDGIWTPRTTEAFDAGRNSRTVLKLDRIEYNVPMKDTEFTREALQRAGGARHEDQ